jgi:hypothetical protein
MVIEVSIGPTFPRRAIVDRDFIWEFMTTQQFRGGGFLPRESLRRTNDGALGRTDGTTIGDLTQYGFIFWKTIVELHQTTNGDNATNYWNFGSALRSTLKPLILAARFYATTHYRGSIQIDVRLSNCFQQSMPFVAWDQFGLDDFRSVERTVSAEEMASAETLDTQLDGIINRLMTQICWSFWQPPEPFPGQMLTQSVSNVIRGMGRR